MPGSLLSDQRWLQSVARSQPRLAELLGRSPEEQKQAGYFHTLHEILQQPTTWTATAERLIAASGELLRLLASVQCVVLTGSGSSEYVGDCVCAPLQQELGVVVEVIGGGTLLAHGKDMLPPLRPAIVVSLGRSGDSPESVAAVSGLLQTDPKIQHLVLTCNREGGLAREFSNHPNAHVVTLDDATNDRSLVMTSSFTNLALAARSLGMLKYTERYRRTCRGLSEIADRLLRDYLAPIAEVATRGFGRVVFLGSGPRLGAAREAALKILEMTSGAVPTICETYLSFRHGPMSFVQDNTVIVSFLSCDRTLRSYECDLLRELDQKGLGKLKIVVGEDIPRDVIREGDLAVECVGLGKLNDDDTPVIHVVVGQMLAFFRCLEEGLHPDAPSKDGVINRVVPGFRLHFTAGSDGNG
jgi:tagatose-6-phosphate ketose/aldose isomerase